jgi:hypothetical protein
MRVPSMALPAVAADLGIAGHEESWRSGWDGSSPSASEQPAEWMERETTASACRRLSLSRDNLDACLETRDWIAASPARLRAAWHCWHALFLSGGDAAKDADRWPRFTEPPAALFYAVVLLAGLPVTEERHRSLGIPPETTWATLRDLELWMEDHRSKTGHPGLSEFSWLRRHFSAELFQIGRLQFELCRNRHPFLVLRHRRTAEAAILAETGLHFRDDGNFADADGRAADPDSLGTRLTRDAETVSGFPVTPEGRLDRVTVRLRRDEWECAMEKNDPVLGVHIPAAGRYHGPMDPDSCSRSFRDAIPFFAGHFPDHRFRGFTCSSWLLDRQLRSLLPPDSNIVRFQERFRLVPLPGATDRQSMERIFGREVLDWSRAPRDTSLRRAAADLMLKGGHLRMGGGLILR